MLRKIFLMSSLLLVMVSQSAFATTLDIPDSNRIIILNDTLSGDKYGLGLSAIADDKGAYMPASQEQTGSANGDGIVGNSVAAIAIDCHRDAYYLETDGSNLYRKASNGANDWNMSSNTEGGGYHSLLTHANDWFATWGKSWWDGVNASNWKNYRVNVDEDNNKYVANSLYIRYINITGHETLDGWNSGPYITTGTNFDDVLMYAKITADPAAYVKSVDSELGGNILSAQSWLWNQGNSVFEKHAEFRWYFWDGIGDDPGEDPYAYVYPLERVQEIQQTQMNLGNPAGALTTNATGSGNNISFNIAAKVDLPIKNDDLSASQINLYTSQKTKTYSYINGNDPSISAGEPSDKQLKAWNSNINGIMTIYLPNGKTYTKNIGNNFNFSTNVSVSTLGTGNLNLTGSLVKVVYTWDENQRFMTLKDEKTDMYTIPGKTTNNYADIQTYIKNELGDNSTNQKAIASITQYHNSKSRPTKKTYTTITNRKTITISGSLSYVTQNTPKFADIKPLSITTKVYPSQPTTVLEGGSMYATIDAKGIDASGESTATKKAGAPNSKTYRVTSEGASPEPSYAEWQSDVKLDQIKFVAKDGNVLYDSLNSDNPPTVTSTNNLNRIAVRVPGGAATILAGATDIGPANVVVDYSYHWKIRQLTKTVAGKTAVYRTEHRTSTTHHKDGSTSHHSYTVQVFDHYDYWWDKTYTTTEDLPQMGEQSFPFTIYSLSSETTKK